MVFAQGSSHVWKLLVIDYWISEEYTAPIMVKIVKHKENHNMVYWGSCFKYNDMK